MKANLLRTFFISEEESKTCSKLLDYFKGEDSVINVHIPGCDPRERHSKPADLARHLVAVVVKLITTIHRFGWSLNGDVSLDDIFITPSGSLKVKISKMKSLKRCKDKRERKDMVAIARVVRSDIFKRASHIPHDIQHLLWLLRHYRSRYSNLVCHHPSLKKEGANLFMFDYLHAWLQHIFVMERAKYGRIVSKIPYCKMDQDHWKLRAQQNKYLMKILQPDSTLSTQVQPSIATDGGAQPPIDQHINSIGPEYSNSGDGLLNLMSKLQQNLNEIRFREVKLKEEQDSSEKGKERVVLFEHSQVQHMFDAAFPQAICRFLKAMHAENALPPQIFGDATLSDMVYLRE